MNNHLRISEAGLKLIKSFEGLRLEAYICPAGVLTIGYGHTNLDGTAPKVVPGMRISKAEAERILRRTVVKYEQAVRRLVKVRLSQHQYDALVSFTFNLGETALARSTLLRKLNSGNHAAVPAELMKWTKGRVNGELKVLNGLVRRRQAEGALWLTHDTDAYSPARLPYYDDEYAPGGKYGEPLPQIIESIPDEDLKGVAKTGLVLSPIITAASGFLGSFHDWKMLAVVCVAIAASVAGYVFYKEWKQR